MVVPARLPWNKDVAAAVLLCAAAGMADAVGYVHGGIFAANMTGNTVLAGLAVAQGEWLKALERVTEGVALAAPITAAGDGIHDGPRVGSLALTDARGLPQEGPYRSSQ